MDQIKEAYPLAWPVGYERNSESRSWSQFKQTSDKAQRFLRDEIKRLVGRVDAELIVSTNLRVRADGGIYASDMDKIIPDPGVAIYFKYKGKSISMCCDKYRTVWENIYALAKGIEALRSLDRWGVSDFIDRAFTGFAALPPAREGRKWWAVLEFKAVPDSASEVKERYRALAKKLHPDAGGNGSVEEFQELTRAFVDAQAFFKLNQ